uniref:Uncharacterized protein n=1 Tax=Anguilla anguilla TaxID=7936 RepID=A0A0E9VW62_ANGAN
MPVVKIMPESSFPPRSMTVRTASTDPESEAGTPLQKEILKK